MPVPSTRLSRWVREERVTGPDEIVLGFSTGLRQEGRQAAAARYMSPDITLHVAGEPPTVGRDGWLARTATSENSFPDMREAPAIEAVEGNAVQGTNTVTARLTGDLDLSAVWIGVIPPTNRTDSMTLDMAWTVGGDRIIPIAASMPGGPAALLQQLGAALPRPS